MSQKTPAAEMPVLNFIRDVPASEDAFGSHSRVARAVAAAIHTQKDLKVIGLLGAWGSGKSTVVKLAKAELEKAEGIDTHVFTYDAWLHQSDPPRRSFLETLIKFLLSRNVGLSRDKWQARLDELNRRIEESDTTSTPTLTGTGRAALFLLLLLPFGMQFIGHDWIKDIFTKGAETYVYVAVFGGTAILLLPVLFSLGLYLWWRPTWNPFTLRWLPFSRTFFSRANWVSHKPPHEHDSILSLVMNKEVNRVRNRITRSPEPTAIEFQSAFREIMKEVSKAGRRFIFVIDNLDRLPETQAVAMWSTIRSFFLGAADVEDDEKKSYLPTVVLPVDETAVARMYAEKTIQEQDAIAGGADLARSFMEKTFDLTFRVTRPVLSDWKVYLDRQMKHVFGKHLREDWSYIVGMFIEKSLVGVRAVPVTPRIVNTHINRIGTLWLQWQGEDIAFASIAYYAVFFGDGEPDIHQQVASPLASIASLDPDWRRAIAAIYYGCKPAAAMQILIEQRLRAAIEESNRSEFEALSVYPGFDQVLRGILDLFANGDVADPAFVVNAASLLDEFNPPDQPWVRYAWKSMRAAFRKPTSWQKLREEDARSFAKLMAHCDATQSEEMLAALAVKLAAINEAIAGQPRFANYFAGICLGASKAASEAKIVLPDILVPGAEELFLEVLAGCAGDDALLNVLKTKASDDQVVSRLSGDLSDPTAAPRVETKVRALIDRKPAIPWGDFINAAGQIVQDQDVAFTGFLPALECLGLLRQPEKTAGQRIAALFESGALVSKLHLAHSQKRLEIEARLLALLLLTSQSFDPPDGQAWQALLEDRPELVELTDKSLLAFDTADNIDMLVEHAVTNPNTLALVRGIVSLRVKEDRIDMLRVEDVIARLPQYLSCIENDQQEKFIWDFSDYETFWETIEAQGLDANVIRLLGELIKTGSGKEAKARETLEKRLKAVTAEEWTSALNTGAEPLPIAVSLSGATSKATHLGTALYDALEAAIEPLLKNDNGVFRERWFRTLDLVTPSSRITLLKTVRDRITLGTPVGALPVFLAKGGDVLLADGAFIDQADGAVRHVVWSLLGSVDGINWLSDSAAKFQPWLARSDKATRDVTLDRLSKQWNAADDVGKERLSKLADAWDLPELPVEDSVDIDEVEAGSQ